MWCFSQKRREIISLTWDFACGALNSKFAVLNYMTFYNVDVGGKLCVTPVCLWWGENGVSRSLGSRSQLPARCFCLPPACTGLLARRRRAFESASSHFHLVNKGRRRSKGLIIPKFLTPPCGMRGTPVAPMSVRTLTQGK